MREFERTATVASGPEEAFRFLSDPSNLPQYVATMSAARSEGAGRLHVAAEVQGRHEEGHAHFRADASSRRLEWGAEGSGGYRGWLQVSEESGGASVTIHLNVPRDEDETEINRVLDETVANIQGRLGTA